MQQKSDYNQKKTSDPRQRELLRGAHNTSYKDKINKGSKTKLDVYMQRKNENYSISTYDVLTRINATPETCYCFVVLMYYNF